MKIIIVHNHLFTLYDQLFILDILQAPGLIVKKSGINATDDDINDVAAMGGVNLAEESKVGFQLILILINGNYLTENGLSRSCRIIDTFN